ncbi:hypothetical protein [Bradyrhizobium viridifuturi]|uniref:hypothetical protein n=1 Tax=Bradyrhizobium viridifuturi TaxID=1654716 RepID=UPI00067F198B|nr:hypothetical protein [Bradyrhizobium viridifuturi]
MLDALEAEGIDPFAQHGGVVIGKVRSSCMAALTLCLAGVALADDLQTVGNSDSLGFSAWRLDTLPPG